LDGRISKLNPLIEADCTVPILYANEPQRFISNIASINDAIYIIAPETRQTLQKLVERAQATGKISLNSKFDSIARAADKAVLDEHLRKNGFSTPKTITFNIDEDLTTVKAELKTELSYPILIKPTDGTSCDGIYLIKSENELKKALAETKTESPQKVYVAQEFVKGESTSVSLISNGKKAVAISLNKQQVTLAQPGAESHYDSGCVPFEHPLKQQAFALTEKVVESLGLRGYVGVDVILGEDKPYVVDVNPRLTTSYVGLRAVAGFNVGQAVIEAVVDDKLPFLNPIGDIVCFSKIQTPMPNLEAFQQAAKLKTVVSPPFPLNDATTYALIMGQGKNMQDASLRLEEAKKTLCSIMG
jgi:tyramine---L-glutamate ligase